MGISSRRLRGQGLAWVLHRLKLEIPEPVLLGDSLVVATWPRRFEGVAARRDFLLETRAGVRLGAAASRWVVMDLDARRVVRLPEPIRSLPVLEQAALELDERPLPAPTAAVAEERFRVRRSDLDASEHLNNVRYVEWLLDTVPEPAGARDHPIGLEVSFRREAGHREVVLSRAAPGPGDTVWHVLVGEAEGRELARAVTRWTGRVF